MKTARAKGGGWLDAIEALKSGDRCEVKYGGYWREATVTKNGGASYWGVTFDDGTRMSPYIEHVRCVGQVEAWPRFGGETQTDGVA